MTDAENETAGKLRQVAAVLEEGLRRRDILIRCRRQEGASLRQIAQEAGLSHTAVSNVIERAG